MATERYTVRVTKDYLVFCSGHFITYDGDQCERLHGHNYRAAIELEGPLDPSYYLFDFVTLKNIGRRLTDELDHFMMLPTRNPHIKIKEVGPQVHVSYKDREWVFPRSECVLLPIENTTAELLGRYLAVKLLEELEQKHHFVPDVLRVEIEESFGQSATYEWRK
ncbi:6-carboxytetrahydropterin synthase [Telmatocola sphagniphila]|jgi:6-pyruvoyltetrahydropterin/6-carboxytetrahydropterin synthase|uniref:6-carboxy-5,6,7,8-tetrahydropterin synthase n=1 Tax=Telmatocola sphagniphila TaxID=1123043 RepID=A0A8E6ETE3_9BACT|nr:6-carboxytetrahydropterin synthase [Telmatocola sphagniphila]QVL29812.1 6-carboxytetrahydropterin synthase [Telmatocola sphagniphila]